MPALNHEIRQLAAAGCKWIQLDEPATPGYAANDPHTPADIARLFNACIEGVSGVHFSLHICFGSFRKLPYAKKTYARYFPDLLEAKCRPVRAGVRNQGDGRDRAVDGLGT